jgi:dTDP-4-amino-4,6-dideoxy-D-galactose acyltransferase
VTDLLKLLDRYPYWPHVPRGVSATQVARFAEATLRGGVVTFGDAGAIVRLDAPWDTEQLGVRAGRIVPVIPPESAPGAAQLVAASLADADRDGYRYLITRVDAGDVATVQHLEAAGFRIVDAILSQYLRVAEAHAPPPSPGVSIRAVKVEDGDALARTADESFTQSRFHCDPFVGLARARALYRMWASNLARGLNDLTLIAEVDGDMVGFLSVKSVPCAPEAYGFGIGRIELVAVKESHRGRGVVRALTARLVELAPGRGWALLGIGTQASNVRAIRAYQRVGFTPGDSIFTLRWLAQG